MAIEHDSIVNAELHEPKGVSSASNTTVYVANGAGSGTWRQLTVPDIDTSAVPTLNKITLTLLIPDLDTAESHYIVSPYAGTLAKMYSVIDAPVGGADTLLTTKIGGVDVTDGAITISYTGSAIGDVDSCTPSALNTVTAGQAIEIECDGGTNTSAAHAHLTIVINVP